MSERDDDPSDDDDSTEVADHVVCLECGFMLFDDTKPGDKVQTLRCGACGEGVVSERRTRG